MNAEKPPLSHSSATLREGTLAVVLVHFGSPELTLRCVRSLADLEPLPHRVIVVDHGPLPGLEAALAGAHPQLTVLASHGNPGFGAGCNLGAELAFQDGARWVWFLNNDATLEGATLAALTCLALTHPAVGLWGTLQRDGATLVGADRQPSWCEGGCAEPALLPEGCRQLQARETLSGASILISQANWVRMGPWPEQCFLYLEDTEWCLRAHRLGLPMALTELAVVHPRSSTTGRRSPLSVFYGVRNQLRLHSRLHPAAGGARLVMAGHLLQKRLFQGRWQLLKHTWNGILAAWRGQAGRDPRY